MSNIEYEMPDEYKRHLEILMEFIKDRDEYAKILPTLSPAVRAEAMPAYRELCAATEDLEQKLADEYERFQAEQKEFARRREERHDKHLRQTAKIYLHIKRTKSQQAFDAYEAAVIEEMTPAEE